MTYHKYNESSNRKILQTRSIVICSLFTLIFAVASGCGTTTTVTGNHGYRLFFNSKVTEIGITKGRSEAQRIAVLPFYNTARFAHSMDADLSAANRKIKDALARMDIPHEFIILNPFQSQSLISSLDLTHDYAQLMRDYEFTGLVDSKKMQKLMRKLDVDLLLQGVLSGYSPNEEFNTINRAAIQFFAFSEKGTIDWNVRVVAAYKKYDLRQKEESQGKQVGLGFLGGAMFIAGSGMMGGSALHVDSTGAFLGLLSGGAVLASFSALPFYYALKDEKIDKSEVIMGRGSMDYALNKMIDLAMKSISRKLRAVRVMEKW